MACSNPFFDDMRSRSGVDPPQTEDLTEISELVNDPLQTVVKPNGTVSSSVRELLECPVCLNAIVDFLCKLSFQLGMAPVYIAFLRFMGDDNEAKNYTYSLEVGGNGRKMTWQGVPRSIRESHRKVRDSFDGLIIQRNMALFFSGGDRKELKLRVTGRIWKEQ
ncbi:hypothetical protein TSUD_119010 [Trifolium subterraneum]|uniref:Seven-in-absentia protein TRAF-like domain-containing protein n=1 Tax=Trifolium subterraneum TaxID=3900 RepID=A0A2Z6N678_TRISU|nr:hypothetical protein TSUD_119010 [Trifolium subterraneum]